MSEHFKYKCDKCGKLEDAKYNGGHLIAPDKWLEVKEDVFSKGHLCPECNPFKTAKKKS